MKTKIDKNTVLINSPLINAKEFAWLADQSKKIKPSSGYKHHLESQFSGMLPTKKIGSGMDYAESRVYQAGDDPRFINWRLTARSNETLVKNFHVESNPSACILMDRGKAMRFGTRKRLKISQAARVTTLLSLTCKQHRLALGGIIIGETENTPHGDDEKGKWFPTSKNEQAFNSWVDQVADPCLPLNDKNDKKKFSSLKVLNQSLSLKLKNQAQIWHITLQNLADKNPVGSIIYLVSDFVGLNAEHQTMLQTLQSQHYVIAIHISDPAEHELSSNGKVLFKDAISSVLFSVKTSNAKQREQFHSRSKSYRQSIKKLFEERGIQYISISTVDDDLSALLPLPLEAD